jgi:hypothetical protein
MAIERTGATRPVNEAELAAGLPATPNCEYAQRVGNHLFVAGQVPRDAHGRLVGPDDPRAQALQCLKNLGPATLLGVARLGYVGLLVEVAATGLKE